MKLVLHQNPDLDAVACAAFVPNDGVHFWPAGVDRLPARCPCCGERLDGTERILDHPLGDKGRLDADGTRHAAACAALAGQDIDPDLLAEIDEQDSTGKVDRPRFSLARIVAGLRMEGRTRGLIGAELDRYVVDIGSRVLRGLQILYRGRQIARDLADRIETVSVGPWRFALVRGGASPELGIELNERGYVGLIYAEGCNLGVTRFPGRDQPDLRRLAPHLPGWFVHTAGFLASWGSRKSPKYVPPPAGTPQDVDQLAKLLCEVFR